MLIIYSLNFTGIATIVIIIALDLVKWSYKQISVKKKFIRIAFIFNQKQYISDKFCKWVCWNYIQKHTFFVPLSSFKIATLPDAERWTENGTLVLTIDGDDSTTGIFFSSPRFCKFIGTISVNDRLALVFLCTPLLISLKYGNSPSPQTFSKSSELRDQNSTPPMFRKKFHTTIELSTAPGRFFVNGIL